MYATLPTVALLGGAALIVRVCAQGQTTSSDMGPGALLWPQDRPWTADDDNVAPCGSPSGPGNRTDFPLTGGLIALVYQKESYDVQLGISYKDDPKSNDDFSVLITPERMADIDPGHECVSVPDPPAASATAGSKATFQIKYIAQFDNPFNQTFYACADVAYVATTDFKTTIPCFNATLPKSSASTTTGSDGGSPTSTASPSSTPAASTGGGDGSKMSGGAIAGTVVGCVVGLLLVVAIGLLWRRNQQLEHKLRQSRSMRGVAWEDQFKNKNAAPTTSEPSIELNNMSPTAK